MKLGVEGVCESVEGVRSDLWLRGEICVVCELCDLGS
jgi:hypothetical protein